LLENYFSNLASGLGITETTLFISLVVWDLAWRSAGVWKSTKNNQPVWSVLFVLFQTIGILPILYIFVFSRMRKTNFYTRPIKIKRPERKKRVTKKK